MFNVCETDLSCCLQNVNFRAHFLKKKNIIYISLCHEEGTCSEGVFSSRILTYEYTQAEHEWNPSIRANKGLYEIFLGVKILIGLCHSYMLLVVKICFEVPCAASHTPLVKTPDDTQKLHERKEHVTSHVLNEFMSEMCYCSLLI